MSKTCFCNQCGMEFEIEKFDKVKDTLKDGTEVKVISFTCPKCDEQYIVSVVDEEADRIREEWKHAEQLYLESKSHEDKREMVFLKKKMHVYSNKLKKRYIKELKRRG